MIPARKMTAVVGLACVLAVAACGSTPATDLSVGDCFTVPEESQLERLPVVDCDEDHDSQFFHEFVPSDMTDEQMLEVCNSELTNKLTRSEELGEVFIEFYAVGSPGQQPDNILCLLYVPDGLTGSHVAE